jgi:hypothetical protein
LTACGRANLDDDARPATRQVNGHHWNHVKCAAARPPATRLALRGVHPEIRTSLVLSAFLAQAPEQPGTRIVLTVLLDQSALYGLLEEIGALVLDLLDIRKLTPEHRSPEPRSPGPGDSHSPS